MAKETKKLKGKDYPLKCPNCGSDDFLDEGIAEMDEKSIIYEMRCGKCDETILLEWGPFIGWITSI